MECKNSSLISSLRGLCVNYRSSATGCASYQLCHLEHVTYSLSPSFWESTLERTECCQNVRGHSHSHRTQKSTFHRHKCQYCKKVTSEWALRPHSYPWCLNRCAASEKRNASLSQLAEFLFMCQFIHPTTLWGRMGMTGLEVGVKVRKEARTLEFLAWRMGGWGCHSQRTATLKETRGWGRDGKSGSEHAGSKVMIRYVLEKCVRSNWK